MKHRHCSESETQNCAMVAVFGIIFVVETRQTQLTLHNRAWIYGQGFTSFPSSSTSAEYDGVWFSAGSAPSADSLICK